MLFFCTWAQSLSQLINSYLFIIRGKIFNIFFHLKSIHFSSFCCCCCYHFRMYLFDLNEQKREKENPISIEFYSFLLLWWINKWFSLELNWIIIIIIIQIVVNHSHQQHHQTINTPISLQIIIMIKMQLKMKMTKVNINDDYIWFSSIENQKRKKLCKCNHIAFWWYH